MNRRWLAYLGVGAGLIVAAVVAVLAYQSLQVPFDNAGTGGNASTAPVPETGCSPTPCADVKGYSLRISNVQIVGNLVTMQVTFRNSSDSTHASPQDLTLVDSKGQSSSLITGPPGCSTWTRHEFNNGQVFGPVDICFRVSTAAPPLTLHWTPDFGLFCCETDIVIS